MDKDKSISPNRIHQFLADIQTASCRNKREWILSFVTGKDVLDLGIIDHGLEYALGSEKWLHNHIRTHAASVIGVDILANEVTALRKLGYDVECADVQTMRLDRKFDVVVCGDLIEHVTNPGSLIETIEYHLKDDGVGLVTTPNPFAVGRFFQILTQRWIDINYEHTAWFCPQTMFQLVERYSVTIDKLYWLETDYTARARGRFFASFFNAIAPHFARVRPLLNNDFGVVIKKDYRMKKGFMDVT